MEGFAGSYQGFVHGFWSVGGGLNLTTITHHLGKLYTSNKMAVYYSIYFFPINILFKNIHPFNNIQCLSSDKFHPAYLRYGKYTQ